MPPHRPWFAFFIVALLCASGASSARHRNHASDTPGEFDYYLLSLSWSPAFCLESPGAAECSGLRRYGFIVHGLWPQNERGWPEHCDVHVPVPDEVVQGIADLMPARALVYHEWSAHGTCSGLPPAQFFALVRRAYASIVIPPPLKGPTAAVEQSTLGGRRGILEGESGHAGRLDRGDLQWAGRAPAARGSHLPRSESRPARLLCRCGARRLPGPRDHRSAGSLSPPPGEILANPPLQLAVCGIRVRRSRVPIERPGLGRARRLGLVAAAWEDVCVQRRLDVAEHCVVDAHRPRAAAARHRRSAPCLRGIERAERP